MLFYLTPYMDKIILHEFCNKKRRINKFEKRKKKQLTLQNKNMSWAIILQNTKSELHSFKLYTFYT